MAWYPKRVFQWLVNGLANSETGPQGVGAGMGSEATDVSDVRALQLSAVWSCVRLISESVACLPLGFYERTADSREALPESHDLVRLLKRHPNQIMTDVEFREAMTTQLVLWGNGYARIDRRADGTPTNLTPLIPGKMDVIRRGMNGVYYEYYSDTGIETYQKRDIFHLKGFSAEGVIGFSPLALARQSMGLSVAAEQYSAGAFRRGGRPLGTLNFEKFLTNEQRAAARDIYEDITSGAMNNARSWVLEGGTTYTPISIPPDDLQMLQSRQFQLGEIARFFRVPSHLINDSEKATSWGSGLEQLDLGFLKYTLTPYLKRWETTIRDSLMRPVEQQRLIVEHNVEGMLRTDSKARAEFYSSMAQNGLMTRNEIRKKENLPMVDGADSLTVQVNLTPLEGLGELPPEPEIDQDAEIEKYFGELAKLYTAIDTGSER